MTWVNAEIERQVLIDYTNYKGERRSRIVVPKKIRFMETPHHKPAQWVLDALDLEKNAIRSYALKDIHSWKPVVPPTV